MARTTVLRVIARMNVGGPAQQIVGLLRGLDSDRYEHLLAIGRLDDGEADWLTLRATDLVEDPRIQPVPSLGRSIAPANDLHAYRELRAIIRRVRPDVVHTHTAKAGFVGRLAAFHEGVPAVVHTFHGHVLHGYFGAATTAAVRRLEARLARRTDALLAVGTRVRDELLAAGIGEPEQYTVMPPGVVVPAAYDRDDARRRLGLPTDARVVAFVGRMAPVKRVDRFLEVAEGVARQRPETVFVVAGGGEPGELARLQRDVRAADVRFLGWVGDVAQVYAAADLILLTSDNEGMPVSLIEAGMVGCPAVATDVGSVREVVIEGVTGRVVSSEVGDLVDVVAGLIADDGERQRYSDAAREYTQRSFGMDRLVSTTQATYESLGRAQGRGRGSSSH